jgi:beta-lactamase superfamily II metal-dependent hydrolase
MKLTLAVAGILLSIAARADYLITSRSANIKAEPITSSATLENVPDGTRLNLLDGGAQTNHYYHVITLTGTEGWVYRTLARRYSDTSASDGGGTATAGSDEVEIVAIDVGAGLSCLIRVPGNRYIIYDGGRSAAYTYLRSRLPVNSQIEAMILSHTDADHWGAVEAIVRDYRVKKVIRTDYRVNSYSQTYQDAVRAIENATNPAIDDYNLGVEGDLQPGTVLYNRDGVRLVALCGFSRPPASWGNLDDSKANNAVSIVVRLEYGNRSVILAGDAVGKEDCDETNACIATEKYMIDNVSASLLNADILVAAHHGADNASCQTFIDRVSPDYVVFSAGHMHRHPRQVTVERFINWGVDPDHIFRTDRGDEEDSAGEQCMQEWSDDQSGEGDQTGDDHIRMVLPASGRIRVSYVGN